MRGTKGQQGRGPTNFPSGYVLTMCGFLLGIYEGQRRPTEDNKSVPPNFDPATDSL